MLGLHRPELPEYTCFTNYQSKRLDLQLIRKANFKWSVAILAKLRDLDQEKQSFECHVYQ